MSRGMPSMTALLGLLAVAGHQNRDKLPELLKGAGNSKYSARREHSRQALERLPGQSGWRAQAGHRAQMC